MFQRIKLEIRDTVTDWYKYMDTTVPEGVNRKLFTHLKYANKNRLWKFLEAHPQFDRRVVEKQALHEYLKKDDEEIVEDLMKYYDDVII